MFGFCLDAASLTTEAIVDLDGLLFSVCVLFSEGCAPLDWMMREVLV